MSAALHSETGFARTDRMDRKIRDGHNPPPWPLGCLGFDARLGARTDGYFFKLNSSQVRLPVLRLRIFMSCNCHWPSTFLKLPRLNSFNIRLFLS